MKTRYPVKFNNVGKLVKYPKPYKDESTYTNVYKTLDAYNKHCLKDLVGWVFENGGELKDTNIEVVDSWGDVIEAEVTLTVYFSQEELDKKEKEYQKSLKDWEEWKVLSKESKQSEEVKNKAIRAKALKTQEKNLLAKLNRVRKQQNNL